MKFAEDMSHDEFVQYLDELISNFRNTNEEVLIAAIKKARSIIMEQPQISINPNNGREVLKGKRVSIYYDNHYYFLVSNITKKPFAPALTKKELIEQFKSIENNRDE